MASYPILNECGYPNSFLLSPLLRLLIDYSNVLFAYLDFRSCKMKFENAAQLANHVKKVCCFTCDFFENNKI